jgi:hypothetical protein
LQTISEHKIRVSPLRFFGLNRKQDEVNWLVLGKKKRCMNKLYLFCEKNVEKLKNSKLEWLVCLVTI